MEVVGLETRWHLVDVIGAVGQPFRRQVEWELHEQDRQARRCPMLDGVTTTLARAPCMASSSAVSTAGIRCPSNISGMNTKCALTSQPLAAAADMQVGRRSCGGGRRGHH